MELYERAIEKTRSVEAMFCLAQILATGADGVEKNVRWAVELLEETLVRLYEDGAILHSVKVSLGIILEEGAEDVEKDVMRAVELYEQEISEHNNLEAILRIAMILQKGAEGVEKDAVGANNYFLRVICSGDGYLRGVAMVRKAFLILTEDLDWIECRGEEAAGWLQGALNGYMDSTARLNLAWLLRTGTRGTAINVLLVIELLEGGLYDDERHFDHLFLLNIGTMLLSLDVGSLRNPARAKKLLLRSVSIMPTLTACVELAELCYEGDEGVPRDVETGREMLELVVANHLRGRDEKEMAFGLQDPATHRRGRWLR